MSFNYNWIFNWIAYQIRGVAVSYLQRSVVAAEKLSIDVDHVQRSLVQLVLPMTNDLSKLVAAGSKDFPQCDATVRELIRAIVKVCKQMDVK